MSTSNTAAYRYSTPVDPRDASFAPVATPQTHGRSTLVMRDIEALDLSATTQKVESTRDYRGRYRKWPGLVLLLALLGVAGALISIYGIHAHSSSVKRDVAYEKKLFESTTIQDGQTTDGSGSDVVSDDGAIGNPKKYPPSQCELPDYQSKNGQIVAVSANGTEVPIKIKGINWFGMETGDAVPLGLWDNTENGTTIYQIASFLQRNKFNAVRLPLMAQWLLDNKVPRTDYVNLQANRGLSLKNYMSLIKSIVKALQYRNIAVLFSMHTLTLKEGGDLWYLPSFPEAKFLDAIDVLTKNLCDKEYWNIMGVDLKNEPYSATWGDGAPTDFRDGAKRIADRMLGGCSSWMGFVEGIYGTGHKVTIDGKAISYADWYGSGLQGVKTKGLEFSTKNKVVWAPHYYTPAIYPQPYVYGGGKAGDDHSGLQGFVELSDDDLRGRIQATMNDMFGYLATGDGAAVLLGEFGGLYATDAHPLKTTKRCTDYTIEVMTKPGWAGGFVWSLNPESEYNYNPADTYGHYPEGILQQDWLSANTEYLRALAAMDAMENLRPFPCFSTKTAKTT